MNSVLSFVFLIKLLDKCNWTLKKLLRTMCRILVILLIIAVNSAAQKNIVLILCDDLDVVLDGMTPLANTVRLIGDQGATYTNSFVASPICCPNRASILTGRYMHNHVTVNNSIEGGCSSQSWQQNFEPNTFASILQSRSKYKTFYAGKYLNQYGTRQAGGVSHVPKGWDWWAGLVGNSKYLNYTLSINGTEKKYVSFTDYLTDVLSNMTVTFIQNQSKNQPFLMMIAPPAPHSPFIPAARHTGRYKKTIAKRTPNFNNLTNEEKHWLVWIGKSPLPEYIVNQLDHLYGKRWETLLAVDEMVFKIYQTLQEKDLLNDTYIIFTSDNGYHIGQFSLPIDKRQPYETDIRVPLLIRGPGIKPSKVNEAVSSVDIFATILDIGGQELPSDGISLLKNLYNDRTLLIEYKGESSEKLTNSGCPSDFDTNVSHCDKEYACKCEDSRNNTFACIRRVSEKFNNIFCQFDEENYLEAYDLENDEFQINNIAYSMKKGLRHRFRKRLREMVRCDSPNTCVRKAST